MDTKAFPDNLRDMRLLKRLTIAGLAKRAGLAPRTIWSYEAGERCPTLESLVALGMALETDVESLLKDRAPRPDTLDQCVAKSRTLGLSDEDL